MESKNSTWSFLPLVTWQRAFWRTAYHVKRAQNRALEQERFDLRSISSALPNHWLSLVFLVCNHVRRWPCWGVKTIELFPQEFTWKSTLVPRGEKCFCSWPPTWLPWRHVQTTKLLVRHFIFIPHSEFTILVNTDLILCCSQFLFGKS